ncbi:spermidine synthase [Yaniella flava]|uniref:Spermidine synthase n=1 Tax=Yaniella flava TaxID=287930 RepID=A0ABP5FTA5_9MICC
MSKQRRNQKQSALNIEPGIYEIDSGTAEIQPDPFTPGAYLLLVNGVQSSQLIPDEPQRLGFEYMRWIAIALGFRYPREARLRFMHLGGGGATLARWGADRYPNSRHTTVEYDAKLTELARENFGLPRSPIVKMRVGEAGQVLSETRPDSWDVIIRDVFVNIAQGNHITPGHLTGIEAAETAAQAVGHHGAYVINYGGPPNLQPARAEAAALAHAFEHVTVISDATMFKGRRRGNIVMIGTQTELAAEQLGGMGGFEAALRSEPLPVQAKYNAATTNFIAGTAPSTTPLLLTDPV